MRTFLADSNSDLLLNAAGNLETITGPGAVEQAAVQAMLTRRGECVHKGTRGMPFDATAWAGTPQVAAFEAAGRRVLAGVPGVAAVLEFTARLDGEDLAYSATIRTIYGSEVAISG